MTLVHASIREISVREHRPSIFHLWGNLRDELRDRKARRELAELPEHLLRDIGLVDQVPHPRADAHSLDHTLACSGATW